MLTELEKAFKKASLLINLAKTKFMSQDNISISLNNQTIERTEVHIGHEFP